MKSTVYLRNVRLSPDIRRRMLQSRVDFRITVACTSQRFAMSNGMAMTEPHRRREEKGTHVGHSRIVDRRYPHHELCHHYRVAPCARALRATGWGLKRMANSLRFVPSEGPPRIDPSTEPERTVSCPGARNTACLRTDREGSVHACGFPEGADMTRVLGDSSRLWYDPVASPPRPVAIRSATDPPVATEGLIAMAVAVPLLAGFSLALLQTD